MLNSNIAIVSIEKNIALGCTFQRIEIGDKVFRERISDKVVEYVGIKKCCKNDYEITLRYENGNIVDEWLELPYTLSKFGVSKKESSKVTEVVLK